jgi:glycosyltransferase involved in cell wall biosynthesis
MTVSVALIVKDEQRTLARCLDSLAGAVDEIVVVDTGSRDATKEIARRYTERVFDFEWCDDFAAARRFAFERATSDWVFWVDADDVILNAAGIRATLDGAEPEVSGFEWRYVSGRDEWGNTLCEFWRERLVRNDGTFRWDGRIHEVLAPTRHCVLRRDHEVVVEHHPEHRRAPEKLSRNLRILERERGEAGTDAGPRIFFYLANEYAAAGRMRKALACYRKYLRVATWNEERYYVQTRVANLLRALRRYDEAVDMGLQSLKICPHWPDAYFGLAETYYYLADWHKVVHWCEMGRAMPLPDTPLFINPMDYRFNWIIFYTNALFHLGEVEEALRWTKHALEVRPDDEWHRENFLVFTGALETTAPALETTPREACDAAAWPGSSDGGDIETPAGFDLTDGGPAQAAARA